MPITIERVIVVGCVAGLVALVASMVVDSYNRDQRAAQATLPPGPEIEIEVTPGMRSCKVALDAIRVRCDVDAPTCEATNFPTVVSLPTRRVRLLGDGHFVTVGGSRSHEWFVADGQVFTANGGADMACPGLPNIDTRIREAVLARARATPEGSAGCSMADIGHARAAFAALGDDMDYRAERKALREVAKLRGVSLDVLDAARHKVAAECPEGL